MKRRTWYIIALFLPIILPAFLLGLSSLLDTANHPPHQPYHFFHIMKAVAGGQLLFGSIQYILFIGGILRWKRNATTAEIEQKGKFLPLLFGPFYAILSWGFSAAIGGVREFTLNEIGVCLLVGAFVVIIGYFYVLLAHGLTWLLQKAGIIRD